jgi:hypothetical protein
VRTFVRASSRGSRLCDGADRRRSQRLRDRPPSRHPANDGPRLAASPVRAARRARHLPTLLVPVTPGATRARRLRGAPRPLPRRRAITTMPRTQRLRIFLDARYTAIVDETEALLRRGFASNRVGRVIRHDGSMVVLWTHHNHLTCLFPQHGPGKKHERLIELERWQEDLVLAAPWAFIKGCIRSDGCAFVNRTGRYEYSRTASTTIPPRFEGSSLPHAGSSASTVAQLAEAFESTDERALRCCRSTSGSSDDAGRRSLESPRLAAVAEW